MSPSVPFEFRRSNAKDTLSAGQRYLHVDKKHVEIRRLAREVLPLYRFSTSPCRGLRLWLALKEWTKEEGYESVNAIVVSVLEESLQTIEAKALREEFRLLGIRARRGEICVGSSNKRSCQVILSPGESTPFRFPETRRESTG